MSGGSSGTTTTTNQPWSGQQPYLSSGYADASSILASGGPQYFGTQQFNADGTPNTQYGQSTYAGQGAGTQGALQGMLAMQNGTPLGNQAGAAAQRAAQGSDALGTQFTNALNPIAGDLGNIATSNNLGNYAQGQLGGIAQTGGNLGGLAGGLVGGIAGTGGGASPTFQQQTGGISSGLLQSLNPANSSLGMIAGGGMMGAQDPYLAAQYAAAAQPITRAFNDAIMPGIQGNAEMGGRYGSGAMQNQIDSAQQQLGNTLGNLGANLYGNAYQGQAGNMLAASQGLGSQYLQGLGLQSSTAGQQGQLTGQDTANRLAASGQITNATNLGLQNQMAATGQIMGGMGQDTANQLAALQQATGVQGMINQQGNQDIQTQLQGAGMAPALNQMQQSNLQQALGAGQTQDASNQQALNAAIQKWQYGQNLPQMNLNNYMSIIAGGQNPGSQSQQSTSGGLGGLGAFFSGLGGLGQFGTAARGLFG